MFNFYGIGLRTVAAASAQSEAMLAFEMRSQVHAFRT
jgi:hypothetical protein